MQQHKHAPQKKTLISKIRIREAIKKKFDERPNHSKELNEKFVFWCRLELACTVFSMLGLAIAIFDYEYAIFTGSFEEISKMSGKNPKLDNDYKTVYEARMIQMGNTICRWLNTGCTILAIVFLALRNHYRKDWKNNHYNT